MEQIKNHKATEIPVLLGWLVCSMGMIFYFYEFILRIAPSVMETQIRQHFNISAGSFGSLVGLYYVAYTPMQLFVGPIVDLYGLRKIFTFATFICALGTFLFCTTHSFWSAGFGRLMIGFGSAFAFVGALKLASIWLPANRFATFAGLVSALGMLGGMVGDISITGLVHAVGWQATMMYGAIFGVILTPLMAFIVRDRVANQPVVKLHHKELLKEYLKIIRNSQLWLSGMIACMFYLALSGFAEIWGISFLRAVFNLSPHKAAIANSMVFFGWLIGGPLSGLISDRIGNRRSPLIVGGIIAALSFTALLCLPNLSYLMIVLLLLIFGLGSSVELICFAIGHESAPHQVAGTAIAFVNLLTMLSGFVFQPAIGKFLDISWSGQLENGIRVYAARDYRIALSAIPIAMIIGVILTIIIRESFRETKVNATHSA